MEMMPRPLQLASDFVRRVVREGDTVVDATLGNGHDTLFLAKLVGETGKVVGFDVQAQAIESTRARLLEAGVSEDNFKLNHCGHQNISNCVDGEISAAMFNLGYLPRAEKAVITTAETTLPALTQAVESLRVGGVVTVMCYIGHEGGAEEAKAVLDWVKELLRFQYLAAKYEILNAPNSPAFLVVVNRQK